MTGFRRFLMFLLLPVMAAGLVWFLVPDESPRLDDRAAERQIAAGVQRQLGVRLQVDCPADRPMRVGDTFTCMARSIDTDQLRIRATQINELGSVRWDARIRATDGYESEIASQALDQRRRLVTVVCPDVVPLQEGSTFTCVERDVRARTTREVDATITSSTGSISFDA
jgi:hypothetical protein